MRPRSMLLIMIALGCGLVAAFAAFQVVDGQADGGKAQQLTKVFVALTDVDISDKLDSNNVKLEEYPSDRVPDGAIMKLEDLEGRFAATRLYPGEIILEAKLMDSQKDLAQTIPKGYRVCTVKVEVDTSIGGLLRPGDRVDVMVYLHKGNEVPTSGIRTILKDVRVFAVNTQTDRSEEKDGKQSNARTVSFLVKPQQASKLLLAARLGVLQLSLRRPDEQDGNLADSSVSVDSILTEGAERADEPDKSEDSEFRTWLNSQNNKTEPVARAAPPKEAYRMEVIGPEGTRSFVWSNEKRLPREDGDGGAYAPAAAPPLPPAAAPPLPPAAPAPTDDGDRGEISLSDPLRGEEE